MTNLFWEYLEKREGRFLSKWDQYIDIYDHYFLPLREKPITMLEIGVFKGGSIDLWKNYFTNLTYVGLDVNPECKKYAGEGVTIEIGDQEDRVVLKGLVDKYKAFDIVLDDGGHFYPQQINAFEELFPAIKPGGLYICEDVHTSYTKGEYDTSKPTLVEYTYTLIDQLHGYWDDIHKTALTETIGAIHHYDSMVVIEKVEKRPKPRVLFAGQIPEEFIPKTDTRRWKDTL